VTTVRRETAPAEVISVLGRRACVVDLSQCLSNATSPFEPMPHAIEYFDHSETVAVVHERFGLDAEHWREAWCGHTNESP